MKWTLLVALSCAEAAQTQFPFVTTQDSEVIAALELSSPGSDWSRAGSEAAVAIVKLDGKLSQHIVLFAGAELYSYRVSLGRLPAGKHELTVDRDSGQSAAGSGLKAHSLKVEEVAPTSKEFEIYANAPAFYARENTVGKFSDVPLILYCERFADATGKGLEYTVIFSNEDGGTSTRALMARWGRTTDIEYVYRRYSDGRAIVQGPGHKDVEFSGEREGDHPFLIPVTDNNMIAGGKRSALLFRLAPVLVDLKAASRESVMDRFPMTHLVMAKELVREGKLRAFGEVDGEKISDQRNYLFIDFSSALDKSSIAVLVRLKDGSIYASDVGRYDYAIARSGHVRTTVELPPGATRDQIAGIDFECRVAPQSPPPHSGSCVLNSVNGVFKLGADYLPGKSFFSRTVPVTLPTGRAISFQP